ncbi:DinB family protein [Pedobacter sp. MW01-1-1]|uniref:DinB family protein n=1 Tax=Pedobacter sp. MW01-1-1 TaxID=3383027 RepID=UPI003FEE844C
MKNTPESTRIYGLLVLYEMHTKFLVSALDGIGDEDSQRRLNTEANHIAWITGSVVNGRFFLAKCFGLEIQSTTGELFENNKGIISDATYPTLESFKDDWDKISPVLETALTHASAEKLTEPFEMPGMKMSLFDMISFTIYREANCIGQIALWRRLLGYPGMKYM